MKRFIKALAVLLMIILCTSLCSCDRDYDEAEVLSAAKELIEKSYKLNELFYGKGLEYTDEGIGVYRFASEESLNEFGISTVEDMKNMAREIFSDAYCKIIFESDIFTSVKIDDVIKSYTRYYQSYDEDGNPNGIMVRTNYDYKLVGEYFYHDAMEVSDVVGEIIIVRTLATARHDDGSEMNDNIDISMIEEDDGWRLTTATYVIYNGYSDLYDDLINNK